MSTFQSSDATPDPDPGVVTFTARGEQALDELADRLVAESDGTPEGIASLLETVLSTEVDDLAAALRAPAAPEDREQRETRVGIEVDETTPGQSPDEAAQRRLGRRALDDALGTSSMRPAGSRPRPPNSSR